MSNKDENIIYGTQPTGHARIPKGQFVSLQNSGSSRQEPQPEGLENRRDPEGQNNPQAENMETTHSGESGDVSGLSPRPELPSGHSHEVPVKEGENTPTLCTEKTVR